MVNVKVAHIRPEYKDLREWMSDSNNVYIGRGGIVFIDKERYPKQASVWANPYKVPAGETNNNTVTKYEEHIRAKLEADPDLMEELMSLRGKTLGCWCKPKACHGDVLVRIIEENI